MNKLEQNFLSKMAEGVSRTEAKEELNIDADVFQQMLRNAEFRTALLETETEHVKDALYQAALSGNVQACLKWLDMQEGSGKSTRSKIPDEPPAFFDTPEDKQLWKMLVKKRDEKRRNTE